VEVDRGVESGRASKVPVSRRRVVSARGSGPWERRQERERERERERETWSAPPLQRFSR
jgi:hypothetical protein